MVEVCLPVASIQPGDFPSVQFTYFDIGGINNETNKITETKVFFGRNAPSRARQEIRKDDILFSTVRTYLRKIARVELEYKNPVASTGFAVIRAAEGVSPQFLFFQTLSEEFLQPLHALQTGSSYPAVRARDVFAQPVLLPPTNEQERIAAKVNTALSAVQRAEAAAIRALNRLRRYREAVLRVAVTGELTRAWRENQKKNKQISLETGEALLQRLLIERRAHWEEVQLRNEGHLGRSPKDEKWKSRYPVPHAPNINELPKLPEGWTWASSEQLSSGEKYALSIGPFGSNLKVSDYRDSGVPLIFVRNIRTGVFSGQGMRFISSKKAQELSAHQVTGGDILITKMGDPPGDACLYPEDAQTAVITADCIRFSLSSTLRQSKAFFVHALNSILGRQQILQITKGVAQQKVSLSGFSRISMPLPPLAEQVEIVREVEHRLSAADRLVITLEQQLIDARVARQSLLREALMGRLVPQNPEDEPAEILLQRIRLARETESRKLKDNQMSKPRSKIKPSGPSNLLMTLNENGPMTPEELFQASGHSQETVDQFFAELRELTTAPAKVVEERQTNTEVLLKVVS